MGEPSGSSSMVGADLSAPTIDVHQLGVRYGKRWVLRNLTMSLSPGLVGLLGPNGAGKSTLLRVLVSLQEPAEGTVRISDVDGTAQRVQDRLGSLGYLSQDPVLPSRFTAREFVEYSLWLKGRASSLREDALEALAAVDITDEASVQLRKLSGGTRQRVALAAAIAHKPRLLVLDEPTVGLDPTQRLAVRRLLRRYAQDRTVLLSTHIVEDVSHVADRLIVLSSGRVRFDDTPQALAAAGITEGPSAGEAGTESLPMSATEAGYAAVLTRAEGAG